MKVLKGLPSAELARHLFSYNPETGEIIWRNPSCTRLRAGDLAGKISHGYRVIKINDSLYRAHRLIWIYMTGSPPVNLIDHINGDPSDNRWGNLRQATTSENGANSRVRSTNRIGIKGVARIRSKKPQWGARICKDGKVYDLGRFASPQLAQAAYLAAAKSMYGEFARAA